MAGVAIREREKEHVLAQLEEARRIYQGFCTRSVSPPCTSLTMPCTSVNVNPANQYLSCLKFPGKRGTSFRLASHVVAGNEVLRSYAIRYNQNVTVVRRSTLRNTGSGGGIATTVTRRSAGPVLRQAPIPRSAEARVQGARRKNRIRLEVIGGKLKMDGVPLRSRDWSAATELEKLTSIDNGIMPLPDEDWAGEKCALTCLQYMAPGVTSVVSPVGANRDAARHGENGSWAATPEKWLERLSRLIEDVELRRRLGLAGRKTVAKEYLAEVHAPRVLEVLETVCRSSHSRQAARRS